MDLTGGSGRPQPGPTEVVVRIERLVLEGFAAHDRWRIASAVESELSRLLTERGLPPGLLEGGAVATIQADSFAPRAGSRPEAIGADVARAVYEGLAR
jgi:hypothetical protein